MSGLFRITENKLNGKHFIDWYRNIIFGMIGLESNVNIHELFGNADIWIQTLNLFYEFEASFGLYSCIVINAFDEFDQVICKFPVLFILLHAELAQINAELFSLLRH